MDLMNKDWEIYLQNNYNYLKNFQAYDQNAVIHEQSAL